MKAVNMDKTYYKSYEERYKKVYEAGIELWGNSRNDEELVRVLSEWVNKNNLVGKKIVEFACGEGEIGVVLSSMGCHYQGYDIAPSAVAKASEKLSGYPNASVTLRDLVIEPIDEKFDALLDVMGLHMMVTDSDRKAYLTNGYNCLKADAPFLFYRQSAKEDAYDGVIDSIEQYVEILECDYVTPGKREVIQDGETIEVHIPLVPARARNLEGYLKEFSDIGFHIDEITDLAPNQAIYKSAAIYGHKE